MQIVTDLSQFNIYENTAVAIGKFDGVHMGHKALLQKVLEQKKRGFMSVVFSFSPSPAEYFGFSDNKVLTTDGEKEMILSDMGIDYLIEFPFNKENADISSQDFIEKILVDILKVSYIVAGDDLSFGKGGCGNMDMIAEYAIKYGFEAEKIEKIRIDGVEVSSSVIRKAVANGELQKVSRYVGNPYFVSGIIENGAGLGHTIGFPTINLIPEEKKILPVNGVYYSTTTIDGITYNSITNVGIKPTVTSSGQMIAETYIYDFNKDVYGKFAKVSLLNFKRAEQKFNGIEELKAVLMKDIVDGNEYFHNH